MKITLVIEKFLRDAFEIRRGETVRVLLMQLYIFLVIGSLLIVKPVSNSLFLSEFGAEQLPNAFILVAVFASLVFTLYSRLLKRIPLIRLTEITLQISIASLAVFWAFFYFNFLKAGALYVFYVWVAIFAVISTSQFWILANLLFNPREAKRLFGFIGAGAIAGGIFGGYLTNFLAPFLGSEQLLLICMAFLAICIPITRRVWDINGKDKSEIKFQQQKKLQKLVDNPLKLIINSRHLTYLAGIVGIGVLAARLVDYQFSAIASERITEEDQLTAFFGFWLSNLNIVSFIIQLLVTRRVVGVFGVGTSLFFLPLGILVGALGVLIHPALWSALLIKISDGSLKQSVNRAGLELLALPIPPEIKNQAKTFIDVVIDSIATGLGGFFLVFLIQGLDLPTRWVSLLIIIVIGIWIYLVRQIREEYLTSFRARIEREDEKPVKPVIDLRNESVFGGLIRVLEGGDEKQVLPVLEMVKEIRDQRLIPCFKKLLRHPSGKVRLEVLRNIYFYKNKDFLKEVKGLVHDEDQNICVESIHYLFGHEPNDQIKMLWDYLRHKDYRIRGAALLCAARESRKNRELRETFKIKEIVGQTVKEIPSLTDKAQVEFTKINCAAVIGASNIRELFPYLHIFLNSVSVNVLKAAIVSAAQTGQGEFVPVLIGHLANKNLRKITTTALASYGVEIIDVLESHLENPLRDIEIRRNIPRVIATIGVQKSVDVLMEYMNQVEMIVHYEIIKALNHLRMSFPHLKFDDKRVTKRVLDEARNYVSNLGMLYSQVTASTDVAFKTTSNENASQIEKTRQALIKTLEERLDNNLERIFRLLGLKYPPDDIYNAYLGIRSDMPNLRANAVEFLDNLLESGLKKVIIPLVESSMVDALISDIPANFDIEMPSEFECYLSLLSSDDQEVRVLMLKLIGYMKDDRYLPYLAELVDSPIPKVSKAAKLALKEIGVIGKRVIRAE